jgi:hypothetical protein
MCVFCYIGVFMKVTGRVVGSALFLTSNEGPFGCPMYRRCWLLLKALETKPLNEALLLAQAAEQFISQSSLPEQPDDLLPLSAWVSRRIH